MKLPLSNRLRACAQMVAPGSRVADIGTDHGYLPIWLLHNGIASHVIACDLREQPLASARQNAARFGTEGIEFRLSDGLAEIAPDEVDTVVIAGMGGETIIAILEGAAWTKDGAHTLLLQPMTKAADLRYWLAVNGYTFTEERLVWDKNYLYPVLRVTGGGTPQALTERQALTGVALDNDPLYREYLTQQADKLRRTAEGLRRSAKPDAQQRADAAEALAREIEEKRDTL